MENLIEQTFSLLKELNQTHLVDAVSKKPQPDQIEFCNQVTKINESYPGGLKEYIARAKVLLTNSANNVNPYEGYSVSIPSGETVNFNDEAGLKELEELGEKELGSACFVLVAGGLGERLGYPSIKVSIPIELISLKPFLQYYIENILAIQKHSGNDIPLAIMTSDDTFTKTVELLEQHKNFGLKDSQITIMKQEKVPSMMNNDCHLTLHDDTHILDTKPHGHGDVHTLLFQHNLPLKWKAEGKKWIIFFQDTNPLVFRAYPSVLGVSKKNNFEMNTITIPRKPGEAVGAICKLQHENGKNLTINVEYNQLGALMKGEGEPLDEQGYSKYPGNTNSFILSIPEYEATLEKTKGNISEFINPKYTGEHEMYVLNCELLRLAGVEFYGDKEKCTFSGINFEYPAKVVLHPSFGLTVGQIKSKIKGSVKISNSSSLILGPNASLENVDINGAYEIDSAVSNKELKNGLKFDFVEISQNDAIEDYLKIRGYKAKGDVQLEKV